MSGEEFIIAVVAIVGGVGLAGFIFYNIFKLIRTWMSGSSSYDDETFERLARAFMQHKKETEKRLQNLEAIVTDDEQSSSTSTKQIEEPRRTIEIEEVDHREENKQKVSDLADKRRTK